MILSGILHTSLGGFTVIRGVAPLGDLARCSHFDDTYQRVLIETHRSEIERFLGDQQDLFFPEVVLSASLQYDYSRPSRREVNPLGDLFEGKGFTSNVDGLSVRIVKTKLPKSLEVVGGNAALTLAYMEIPDEQLTTEGGLRLFRIDGNHRLSATRNLVPGDSIYQLQAPFCIVLHADSNEKKRFERVVFHNINAKQIPLTSEENLRLILETSEHSLFPDDELLNQSSFGPAYWLARRLIPTFNVVFLSGFKKQLDNKYTLALSLAQFLMTKGVVQEAKDEEALRAELPHVIQALKEVNRYYEEAKGQQLRESACLGVMTAFVYFALKEGGRQLPAFAYWIETNRIDRLTPSTTTRGLGYHYHLGRTQAVDAASLVEVFESVLSSRSRQVFVSMKFGTSPGEEPVYKAIRDAIAEVNRKHELKGGLALEPVRIDKVNRGHSYTIPSEILKIVQGSGLLIADLSDSNTNVYHEVGYLMGLNDGRAGSQDNFILVADRGKLKESGGDAAIGFNLRGWQQIRFGDAIELKDSLVGSLEAHFQLPHRSKLAAWHETPSLPVS